jgi:hypothetical protein
MLGNALKSVGAALASKTSRQAAVEALPGAGLNMAMGMLAGGPKAGLAYAGGDFLLNYPLVALARKISPAVEKEIKDVATGVVTKQLVPSSLEKGVNFTVSLGSGPFVDYVTQGSLYPQVQPQAVSQNSQEQQQLLQRQLINHQQQAQQLAPGTMYQTAGLPRFQSPVPGITLSDDTLRLLAEAY